MYIGTKTMMSAESRWSSKWSLISLFVRVWLKLRECLEKVCEEVQKRGAQMCFTEFDTVCRCKSGTSDRRNFIYWYSLSLPQPIIWGLQLKLGVLVCVSVLNLQPSSSPSTQSLAQHTDSPRPHELTYQPPIPCSCYIWVTHKWCFIMSTRDTNITMQTVIFLSYSNQFSFSSQCG